jgi:hypothetical protein
MDGLLAKSDFHQRGERAESERDDGHHRRSVPVRNQRFEVPEWGHAPCANHALLGKR